jgi:hypothetical protein
MLDERFRRFVGEVAASDDDALSEEARERIVAHVRATGPSLVRRARRERVALTAAGPLLAAAAAVAVWMHRPSDHVEQAATGPVAAAGHGASTAPICASRQVPEGARLGFVAGAARLGLDLGATAIAAAPQGSIVKLADATPCRTSIELASGMVAVHAKDLGGGELRVRAPGGEVTVHGTIFGVTQSDDAFVVEVVEGRVGVVDKAGTHTVSTGERLSVTTAGAVLGALPEDRAKLVRDTLGMPRVVGLDTLAPAEQSIDAKRQATVARAPVQAAPPAGETPPSPPAAVELAETEEPAATPPPKAAPEPPQDPLALAEAARRAGDFQKARDLYRRAGDGSGVTAEAAWVALARMELSLGHAAAALDATKRRQDRFGQGTLGPEALWIDVRAYRQTGDMSRARELAGSLVHRWPSSPQARAAEQWLAGE